VLSLANSADNPSETPLSTWKTELLEQRQMRFRVKGLHQAADILENYGINSETDVSVLDRDDFCKLVSGGLRPLEALASF
jgi:hypothetical protein